MKQNPTRQPYVSGDRLTAYLKNTGTLKKAAAMATMPARAPRSFMTGGMTS